MAPDTGRCRCGASGRPARGRGRAAPTSPAARTSSSTPRSSAWLRRRCAHGSTTSSSSRHRRLLDTQVRFYSSGMFLRLAFAVAVHTDPDVFLVDEILAVGDEPFRAKCLARIELLRREGRTLVVVSHDLDLVSRLCTGASCSRRAASSPTDRSRRPWQRGGRPDGEWAAALPAVGLALAVLLVPRLAAGYAGGCAAYRPGGARSRCRSSPLPRLRLAQRACPGSRTGGGDCPAVAAAAACGDALRAGRVARSRPVPGAAGRSDGRGRGPRARRRGPGHRVAGAFPQTFDAVFHLNAVARGRETGTPQPCAGHPDEPRALVGVLPRCVARDHRPRGVVGR